MPAKKNIESESDSVSSVSSSGSDRSWSGTEALSADTDFTGACSSGRSVAQPKLKKHRTEKSKAPPTNSQLKAPPKAKKPVDIFAPTSLRVVEKKSKFVTVSRVKDTPDVTAVSDGDENDLSDAEAEQKKEAKKNKKKDSQPPAERPMTKDLVKAIESYQTSNENFEQTATIRELNVKIRHLEWTCRQNQNEIVKLKETVTVHECTITSLRTELASRPEVELTGECADDTPAILEQEVDTSAIPDEDEEARKKRLKREATRATRALQAAHLAKRQVKRNQCHEAAQEKKKKQDALDFCKQSDGEPPQSDDPLNVLKREETKALKDKKGASKLPIVLRYPWLYEKGCMKVLPLPVQILAGVLYQDLGRGSSVQIGTLIHRSGDSVLEYYKNLETNWKRYSEEEL